MGGIPADVSAAEQINEPLDAQVGVAHDRPQGSFSHLEAASGA